MSVQIAGCMPYLTLQHKFQSRDASLFARSWITVALAHSTALVLHAALRGYQRAALRGYQSDGASTSS
jgi:hypothetical protein